MTSDVHTGRCLCGAVRFSAEGRRIWVAHCHCESCRRATGAPITTYVGFKSESFAFTAGEPLAFESSPGVTRRFCGRCGTPLTYEAEHSLGETHVHVSTLDRPEDFQPESHIFHEERIDWMETDDGLRRYATLPRHEDESRGE